MKQEKLDRLYKDYPSLFRQEIELACQNIIYVEDGWYPIISICCYMIWSWVVDNMPAELLDQIYFRQIKEKFGSLRISLSHSDDYIRGVVEMAEQVSFITCETCGQPGTMRNMVGLWKTLCDADYKVQLEAREKNKL